MFRSSEREPEKNERTGASIEAQSLPYEAPRSRTKDAFSPPTRSPKRTTERSPRSKGRFSATKSRVPERRGASPRLRKARPGRSVAAPGGRAPLPNEGSFRSAYGTLDESERTPGPLERQLLPNEEARSRTERRAPPSKRRPARTIGRARPSMGRVSRRRIAVQNEGKLRRVDRETRPDDPPRLPNEELGATTKRHLCGSTRSPERRSEPRPRSTRLAARPRGASAARRGARTKEWTDQPWVGRRPGCGPSDSSVASGQCPASWRRSPSRSSRSPVAMRRRRRRPRPRKAAGARPRTRARRAGASRAAPAGKAGQALAVLTRARRAAQRSALGSKACRAR